jgi:hypothetical protein
MQESVMELVNLKTGTDSFVGEDGKPETKDHYPWGLRITLDNETLQRLGLNAKSPPAVGDSVSVMAMANVCSVSTAPQITVKTTMLSCRSPIWHWLPET